MVTGRVQGVFFRATAQDEARRLGLNGWMSNEPDGSVAGHFEGTPEAVAALVDWCRQGPPLARVADVRVSESAPSGMAGFRVR